MAVYGPDEDVPLPSPYDHPWSGEAGLPPEYVAPSVRLNIIFGSSVALFASSPKIPCSYSLLLRCLTPCLDDPLGLLPHLWLTHRDVV